jgi:hypothetical protein
MEWREAALAEVRGLKPHFADKHGWNPVVTETDDQTVDLVVTLTGGRLGARVYALRLRYLSDWQVAGRREAFVDLDDHSAEGPAHWPPDQAVRGVNPRHAPPCICLRGVYGYHSILHANARPTGTTLLGFLLELQAVIDE